MTIRSRVAQLDDFSGELALTLSKLEMEAANGAKNAEEQVDFARDLSRAAYLKGVRPWRSHAIQSLAVGLACVVGGMLLPPSILPASLRRPVVLALIAASLVAAATCLVVYYRRKRKENLWLQQQEQLISAGRPFLDQ